AEGEGRRGEDGDGAPAFERGGPDADASAGPADGGDPALGYEPDARRGGRRPAEAALRRRGRAASAARALPRDDPPGVPSPRSLQVADRRSEPVRRLPHRARAA